MLPKKNIKIAKREAKNGLMVNRGFILAPTSPKLDFLLC